MKWGMHFVLQNRSGLFVFVLCFASLDMNKVAQEMVDVMKNSRVLWSLSKLASYF
jgi:hypothetical protein